MSQSQFAAQILESSASAYAGYAASQLLERYPEIGERSAPHAMRDWKANLTHRLFELSAALGVGESRLFVARVLWTRKAFMAREMAIEDLRAGLVCLREVLAEELPPVAGKDADRYLDQAIAALGRPILVETTGLDPQDSKGRLALQYLKAVLEGDASQAIDLVTTAVDEGLDPQDAYLDVLIPAQREIGEMWHLGELGIAEEHFITTTTERLMTILANRADRQPPNGKAVVAAAVAGNTHGLAVRVVADFFEMAGWRAVCLGADVPPSDLAAAVQYFNADLLLLSAALTTQIKTVRQSIDTVRRLEDHSVKILIGGGAFAEAPDLWQQLHADGHADSAATAVALGEQLVILPEGP